MWFNCPGSAKIKILYKCRGLYTLQAYPVMGIEHHAIHVRPHEITGAKDYAIVKYAFKQISSKL